MFVTGVNGVGHEIQKDRPAVVISHPLACRNSDIVQVVFITNSPKKRAPYHVRLRNGQTVLCEQIYTVDVSRLNWCNTVSVSPHEMREIDDTLRDQLYLTRDHHYSRW